MDNERRYMRLIVPYRALVGILNGTIELCDFVLPDDARVVHVQDDFQMAGIGIIVESASYPIIELGCMVPSMPPIGMRIREKIGAQAAAQFAQQPPAQV